MMIMKTRRILAFAVLALAAAACRPAAEEGRPTIQLVRDIAATRTDSRNIMLRSLADPDRHADIAILGGPEHSRALARTFLDIDVRDNIDGSKKHDGLEDFSGESVTVYLDEVSKASDLIEKGEFEMLRNFVVNEMLSAVDTVYNLAQFDLEGLGRKASAKMIVISDPSFEAYGKFDIDTLFLLTGCGLDVVAPVHTMLDKVFEGKEGKRLTVGILCDSCYAGKGIYREIVKHEFAERGVPSSDAVIFPIVENDSTDILQSYLDRYIASGRAGALDALIVDDMLVDVDSLRTRLRELTSVTSAESLTYRNRVSKDFQIVGASEAITEKCFQLMRDRNLFSHDIAFPKPGGFVFIDRPDVETDGFLTIPALIHVQD